MRPTTSNPRQRASITQDPSMEANSNAPKKLELESSVLWSSLYVPEEMLARPHTSNPRYVDMAQCSDTQTTHSTSISPGYSNDPTSSQSYNYSSSSMSKLSEQRKNSVIWASESDLVDPELLTRPVTSNPWLQRVFDSLEHLGTEECDTSHTRQGRRSEILWSSGNIEDWRILARPIASNPNMEKVCDKLESSIDFYSMPTTPTKGKEHDGHTEILFNDHEDTPPKSSSTGLRIVVNGQNQRIRQLEELVAELKSQIDELKAPREGQSYEQSRDHCVYGTVSVSPTQANSYTIPNESNDLISRSRSQTLPNNSHFPIEIPLQPCEREPLTMTDEETEQFIREESFSFSQIEDDPFCTTSTQYQKSINNHITNNMIPSRPKSALASRRAARLRHVVGLCRSRSANGRPNSRLGARKPPERASTARLVRPTFISDINVYDSNCFNSFSTHHEHGTVSIAYDERIKSEYNKMRREGNCAVLKDDFKMLYAERAAEYGIIVSNRELERRLETYESMGEDYLSEEEFAILFLKIAQW